MSAGIQARVLHKDQNKVNEILDENLDLSGNTFKFLETENESKTSKIDTKIPTAKFLSECRTAIFKGRDNEKSSMKYLPLQLEDWP